MPSPSAPAPERVEAAALLAQLQGLRGDLAEAIAKAGGGIAESDLVATLATIGAAESALAQALQSGGCLDTAQLASVARLIQSSETRLRAAEQTASAEAARAVQDIASAAAATRQEVQNLSRDLFERRIFDPYLHFASAAAETEYRAREAERQRAIAAELARGTSEGNLNAGGIAAGQMLDARAHGASASPDFLPAWNRLTERLRQQRAAMQAAGQNTEAFDRQIAQDVRLHLRKQGKSDPEIDALLASTPFPLDLVQPTSSRDVRELDRRVMSAASESRAPAIAVVQMRDEEPTPAPSATLDLAAMQARLKAAGVQLVETPAPLSGHGLGAQDAGPGAVRGPG